MNVNAIALILLAVTLAQFFRIWVPWGERASGNLVGRETLSVLGRLRMHGPSVALVCVTSVGLLALGKIGPLTFLLVTALLALLLALPVRYTMTSRGIRAAWTPFRRWTEFGGVSRRRGGVRLQGVSGARDDDEFVLLLRQLVRGSYKGRLGPEAGVPANEAAPATGPDPIGIV